MQSYMFMEISDILPAGLGGGLLTLFNSVNKGSAIEATQHLIIFQGDNPSQIYLRICEIERCVRGEIECPDWLFIDEPALDVYLKAYAK